jgi:hypothetical protein
LKKFPLFALIPQARKFTESGELAELSKLKLKLARLGKLAELAKTHPSMAKQPARAPRPAAHASQNYLSLIVALVIFLCLSVAAGFVFISQWLDFSERSAVVGFLIVFPLFAVAVAAWLILQNIRRINLRERDRSINWQIMPPENQRRKLNLEITELAEILAIDESQVSDLRSAYIVAEDLALRKLEQESNISLLRHVSLESAEFDAVLISEEVIKFVEVTFLVTPNIRQEKVTAILRKIDVTKNLLAKIRPGTKLILLLALVTQIDQEAEIKLRSTLGEKLLATPVDVDIRLFDFETLQKIYAED